MFRKLILTSPTCFRPYGPLSYANIYQPALCLSKQAWPQNKVLVSELLRVMESGLSCGGSLQTLRIPASDWDGIRSAFESETSSSDFLQVSR